MQETAVSDAVVSPVGIVGSEKLDRLADKSRQIDRELSRAHTPDMVVRARPFVNEYRPRLTGLVDIEGRVDRIPVLRRKMPPGDFPERTFGIIGFHNCTAALAGRL